jgi:hypothetical protein
VKDRAKQSSSSWYQSLGLITVQGKVVFIRLILDLLGDKLLVAMELFRESYEI